MRINNALEDSSSLLDGRGTGDDQLGTNPVQRKLTPAPLSGYLDPVAPVQGVGGGGGLQPAPPTPSTTPPVDPLAFGPGWEGQQPQQPAPLGGTPATNPAATPGWEAQPETPPPAPINGAPVPPPVPSGMQPAPTDPAPVLKYAMPTDNYAVSENLRGAEQARAAGKTDVADLFSDPEWETLVAAGKGDDRSAMSPALLAKYNTVNAPGGTFSRIHELAADQNSGMSPAALEAKYNDPSVQAKVQGAGLASYTPPTTATRYLQDGLTFGANGQPLSAADPNSYNALSDLIGQTQAGGTSPGVVTSKMQDLISQNPALAATLPKNYADQYGGTLASLGVTAGSGGSMLPTTAPGASSPPTPSAPGTPQQPSTPAAGAGASSGGGAPSGGTLMQTLLGSGPTPVLKPGAGVDTGGASTPGLGSYLSGVTSPAGQYANMTPTDPNNDLRSQTITPGPALDRFKLAQDQLKTFNDATNPYYEASLRDANRSAAGAGRLGSGMLRTSIGDLANQRNLQLETQGQSFLQDALSGSQDDSRANLNSLLAEQQYQTQAQNQSFNQNVVGQQLQDSLTNSAFGRGLSSLNAGSANDPSSMLMMLSGLYGNQASSAQQALAQLISGTTANNQSNASNQSLLAWLASMRNGSSGNTAPTGGTPAPAPAGNNSEWPYS